MASALLSSDLDYDWLVGLGASLDENLDFLDSNLSSLNGGLVSLNGNSGNLSAVSLDDLVPSCDSVLSTSAWSLLDDDLSGLLADSDSPFDLSSMDDDFLDLSLLSDLGSLNSQSGLLDLPLLDLVFSTTAAGLDFINGDSDWLAGLLAFGDSCSVDVSLDLKISCLLLSFDFNESLLDLLATALLVLNYDNLLASLVACLDGNLEDSDLFYSLGLDLDSVSLDLVSYDLDLSLYFNFLSWGSFDDLSFEINDLSLSNQLLFDSLIGLDLSVKFSA